MIDPSKNLHFQNDNLAIFDAEGRQLPQYQRRTLTQLLLDCERFEGALNRLEQMGFCKQECECCVPRYVIADNALNEEGE